MTICPQTASWVVTAAVSAATFLLGLLVPRVWMSKKERKDVDQANYQNSERLLSAHEAAYRAYVDALRDYQVDGGGTEEGFIKVARAGDDYFRQARFTCDAILSDKLNVRHRDGTLVPHFERITQTTLPDHYAFMIRESKKHGFDYRGELRKSDHQSIFDVVEKYSSGLSALHAEPLNQQDAGSEYP